MKSAHSLEALVEEQCRRAALNARAIPSAGAHSEYWPIITVSSEAGAYGLPLAQSIADSSGFALWGPSLLARVAKQLHAVESVLADVDGRVSPWIIDFVRSLVVGLEYSQDEYVRVLTKVVEHIGRVGGAVIVGHGAHIILGAERALRVRVVCPKAVRVSKIAEEEGLSRSAAERELQRRDGEKEAFIRHHFKRDIADPHCFDLIVNSSALSIGQAAELVRQAYRTKFGKLPELRKNDSADRGDEVSAVAMV